MQSVLLAVDRLNAFIGKTFAWCIVILMLAITYEVFRRYVLRDPTTWAYDVSLMLYGALFMMAGAYTLSRNGHVRGDFLYRKWAPRAQAKCDLVLYFLFYFPGILALIYSGWNYFQLSYMLNEHSSFSPDGPVIWPFKGIIPIVGVMMLAQGVVEVVRCIICIRGGDWPQRLHDVEEMEKVILEEAAARKEEALNAAEREATTRGAL
ncbi:TRAP transporter small permease subunit [Bosea sp. 117]|uniref:TRAP transporter small permease subunit n=1 Tax=Bosea sp. 117 TaxID=1125973 RepID=UPI000494D466|nr:TRAP transporter small permease subunit [Bosea sp. 117]